MNEFKRQWAIRMPDGNLYVEPAQAEAVVDYSIPAPMRDYYQMMGLGNQTRVSKPNGPLIFDHQKPAELKLAELQKRAAAMGVDNWGGAVVERLCTPFTSGDPGVEFAAEVVDWVEQHGEQA